MRCSEWKEIALGDVCTTISDTIKKNEFENVVLINTSDVLLGKVLNHILEPNKNLKGQFKKKFKQNDILYSEIRPKNGRFAFVDFDSTGYIASTKLMVIRCNEKLVVPSFLYGVLKSSSVIDELQSLAETRSGTFPQITFRELANIEIKLPSINEQKQIAKILSSIDDKIELNNKINDNLEQQAQAIYDDFLIANNTVTVPISELVDVRDGTHDSPKAHSVGYPLVTSKHLKPYSVDVSSANYISEDDYSKINERSNVETNDILLSMIGTVGLVSFVSDNHTLFAIKNVALFRTSQAPDYKYYLLCYLKSKLSKDYIEVNLAGSTQKYVSLGALRKMPIEKPSFDTLQQLNIMLFPLIDKIIANSAEIEKLAQLRDTLLPKLMSGEIDVSKVEI
ncbi:MAG: restriction endonuclease subunit S [Clostridia bacterium]